MYAIITKALLVFFLLLGFSVRANKDRIYRSQKAGVTIQYIAPDDPRNQVLIDSVLQEIVGRLKKKAKKEIQVFVNNGRLCFPEGFCSNFFSVGVDTLRDIDERFIEMYYSRLDSNAIRKYPLDINATDRAATDKIGIKVIYDVDFMTGRPDWNKLIRVVTYAGRNPIIVDGNQKRDTVRYFMNGYYVSLMTVDTMLINGMAADTTDSGYIAPFRFSLISIDGRAITLELMLFGLLTSIGLFAVVKYWKPRRF